MCIFLLFVVILCVAEINIYLYIALKKYFLKFVIIIIQNIYNRIYYLFKYY
jgi:hypothetical protein